MTFRRNVLKAVGGGSVSLTVAKTGSALPDNEKRLPVVKRGGEIIKTQSVPEDWWEHERHIIKLKNNLKDEYKYESGISSVGISNSEEKIGPLKKSKLHIRVREDAKKDPSANPMSVLPERIDGEKIDVIEYSGVDNHNCSRDNYCDSNEYNSLGGGARLDSNHSSFGYVIKDLDPVLMCSAHAITCAHVCPDYTLEHKGKVVGQVTDLDPDQDWATVEITSDSEMDFSGKIHGTNRPISGHVTQEGLHVLKSDGETVYKRGAKTCKTSGEVSGYDEYLPDGYSTDCEGDDIYVHFTTCTDSGDSGSPHYREYTDSIGVKRAAVIAPHKGSVGDTSVGCAAYRIANKHSVEFDQPSRA
ncbi:hypothetical protein Halru_0264 [Halovivax ruber XH-70]|uniref:Uncharacterized protein n=1 Tax=Halovivax ruber (strain DSM 18193 / JCM 13892 / XH-70) TaxID=797302 RepID=L0I5W3_HALRX|nr:hypothetical protein [Halovivax ruber]AGB14910.1 hypothetical protein Halru_0264 [Halovivax ruber XH-70]